MKVTRRQFLKISLIGSLTAVLPIKVLSAVRPPYVTEGELVSYIGRCPGGFIGHVIVREIGRHDSKGYPVIVQLVGYYGKGGPIYEKYYDIDLANFDKEVPDRFWAIKGNDIYPNVHTYVRVKRYGQTIEEAIKYQNMASTEIFLETLKKKRALING